MTQDDRRINFLLALDRSDEVTLSGFELDFVASNLDRFNFSPKQRVIIDKLIDKYEVKIGWNPDNTKLAERRIAEQARWNSRRSCVAMARKPRETEHAKERLTKVGGVLKLGRSPVKVGSIVRNGARVEDWWIDYATGVFKACPFLAEGDAVEYDFYTEAHG